MHGIPKYRTKQTKNASKSNLGLAVKKKSIYSSMNQIKLETENPFLKNHSSTKSNDFPIGAKDIERETQAHHLPREANPNKNKHPSDGPQWNV